MANAWNELTWGIGNYGEQNNATVSVSGVSASTNTGQATIDPTYLVGEGWGRDTWGNWAWGVNYSVIAAGPNGISASIVTGNEDAFTDITVEVQTAGELQTAITPVGTSANADHEIAASLLISSVQGDTTIEGTALVEPTGIPASINIGDAEAGLLLEVPVTGVALTTNIGNSDQIGTATVDVTGLALSTDIGDVDAVAKYDVTGVSATFTTGTLDITGDGLVIPTGIELTANTITPNIIAWAEVDVGTEVTWSPVDLAA
jgi:hypothetical protein